jgi:hypothetical protein
MGSSSNTNSNTASNQASNSLTNFATQAQQQSASNTASNYGQNTVSQSGPVQAALDLINKSTGPISSDAISGYMSPYLQQVVNATVGQQQQNDVVQQQALKGNAISQNALGGDRAGIAQAELMSGQGRNNASTIANLYNSGYGQALSAAQADRTAALQAAGMMGTQTSSSTMGASTGATSGTTQAQTTGSQATASAGATSGAGNQTTTNNPGAGGLILGGLGLLKDGGPARGYQDGGFIIPNGGVPTGFGALQSFQPQMYQMPQSAPQGQQNPNDLMKLGQQARTGLGNLINTTSNGSPSGNGLISKASGWYDKLSGGGNQGWTPSVVSSGTGGGKGSMAGNMDNGGSVRPMVPAPAQASMPNLPAAYAPTPTMSPMPAMNPVSISMPTVPMPTVPQAYAPSSGRKGSSGGVMRRLAAGGAARPFEDGGDTSLGFETTIPPEFASTPSYANSDTNWWNRGSEGNLIEGWNRKEPTISPEVARSSGLAGLVDTVSSNNTPPSSFPAEPTPMPSTSLGNYGQSQGFGALNQSQGPLAFPPTEPAASPAPGISQPPIAGTSASPAAPAAPAQTQPAPPQGFAPLQQTQNPFGLPEAAPQAQEPLVTRAAVARNVADEWKSAGMSDNGVRGILVNVNDESGFKPGLRHPDQPKWGGEAHYAHGLYQEGGAEWNNYQKWLDENHAGADWRDPRLQNQFTAQNLRENYPKVWNRMNNAKTPEEAAQIFASGYLKPASGPLQSRMNKYGQGVPDIEHYLTEAAGGIKSGATELGRGVSEVATGAVQSAQTLGEGLRRMVSKGFDNSGGQEQHAPKDAQDQAGGGLLQRLFGINFNPLNLTPRERMTMMSVAAGMMQPGGNIGTGLQAGIKYQQEQGQQQRQAALDAMKIEHMRADITKGHWSPLDLGDGRSGLINQNTGEIKETPQYGHISLAGRSGANAGGVFEFRRQAYLHVNPGDEKGALEYAAGHKSMGESDIQKSAIGFAQKDAAAQGLAGKKYQEYIDQRTQFYQKALQSSAKISAAPAQTQQAPAQAAPAAQPTAAKPQTGPVRVNSPQEAMNLPSGTQFITPDGRVKTRP